ncbi:unnamed protein product [Pseudo-nitzschia multistriata]|uniref:Casein kinase I n=1 Tax=Pseudo-nitzschia multistriata TaxID=183589 RepID=A0A448YXH9_9STRA|nr:unnamed protein product [Pseudo-nitzschia multistriata]
MAPSPVGIEISKGKRKWKVGEILGHGACATVCSLGKIENGTCTETNFAVKLAPLPVKKTKKGNSPQEMNAKLLYYEQMIYTTQFRGLQGKLIPNVPNLSNSRDPPIYGDESGYRFFTLERMDTTISAVVPSLLMSKSSSKTINVGPLAVKMLECIKAVHETKNVIRDVKTENFMLTLDKGATGSTPEEKLASRIRLIDLAIATQWTTMYCETDEGGDLIGTPLYSSLNVHSGKKTSFRDDLESLGYVIAEILMQLYSGDQSKQLPWSSGKSDEDIGSMKQSLVGDKESEFYRQLGNTKTTEVFLEYVSVVRGYSFKKLPDYDDLSRILSKLTVPRKAMNSTTKKTAATKRTRNNKSPTNEDYVSPPKIARRSNRRKAASMIIEDEEGCPKNEIDDETVYADAHQELHDMDWEHCVDENEYPVEDSKPRTRSRAGRDPAPRRERTTKSSKAATKNVIDNDGKGRERMPPRELKRRGVRIVCTEGPHKGYIYEMEAGVNEIITIGSKPTSKVGELCSLKNDKNLKGTHVRLDLDMNRRLIAVKVTDKSNGKTYVNRDAVKSTKAFINDVITIGETSLAIKAL